MLKKHHHYKIAVALIYTIALFLDRLDLTIVNIALPTIAQHFNTSLIRTDWVSLAFLIALAVSIPASNWLGKRFGLKRIFIISLFLFGGGSTLCALAPSLAVLILLRFIEGIGGGMLIPTGMTFIYRLYDSSEYASITSYTFIPSLIAPAIAPFLGGVLLTLVGWRYIFLLSGPICIIVACCAIFILREFEHEQAVPFDWLGFVSATLLLIDTFVMLSAISQYNFFIAGICLLLATLLLWLFLKRETLTQHPIINLIYFKNRIFVKANLLQLCFQICHFGAIFLISMYLQVGAGLSAMTAGLIMGMQALGAMITSRYSVSLFHRYSERLPLIIGLVGIAVISPMVLLIHSQSLIVFGLILFFIRGLFSGLCGTPIQTLSVIPFDNRDIGTVNAVFNICRQLSISLGVALSSILIALGMHGLHWQHSQYMSFHRAIEAFGYGFVGITVIALLGTIIAWQVRPGESLHPDHSAQK